MKCRVAGRSRLTCSRPVRDCCASSGGAGYDTIDVAACTQAGVAVVNQAGANAASVAEMTHALLLSLVKRLDESGAACAPARPAAAKR